MKQFAMTLLLVLNEPHLFVGVFLMHLAVVSLQGLNQDHSFFVISTNP